LMVKLKMKEIRKENESLKKELEWELQAESFLPCQMLEWILWWYEDTCRNLMSRWTMSFFVIYLSKIRNSNSVMLRYYIYNIMLILELPHEPNITRGVQDDKIKSKN
jgi:hypothetical protein